MHVVPRVDGRLLTPIPDRMAVYEAPRPAVPKRPMLDVELVFRGGRSVKSAHVSVPKMATAPDVIIYRGRIFVHRTDRIYMEAKCWPAVKELDT